MEEKWLTELRNSYDKVANQYTARIYGELAHKPYDRALLDDFAERLRGRGTLCDLGCGPGHVARYLHERGASVCGVDLSPAMVAQAREQNPGIMFTEGNMLALDVPDGAWAGVVAFYSIIHLPRSEVRRALSEMYRALRPEGLCRVAFHLGKDHLHLEEWWGEQVSLDCTFFSTEEVEAHMLAVGFEIERREEREPYPDIEYPSRRGYIRARKPAVLTS
jgi:SAM-dependent methyltransferase